MMLQFEHSEGFSVMVNPHLVTCVSKNFARPDACLIKFDKDNHISVLGSIEDVGERISTAQQRN